MNKQDRLFTRTPSDLERKYNLGKFFGKDGSFARLSKQVNELAKIITQLAEETSNEILKLHDKMDELYPEGMLFMSVNDVNPSGVLGGMWELYSEGYIVMKQEDGSDELEPASQELEKCYIWKRIA